MQHQMPGYGQQQLAVPASYQAMQQGSHQVHAAQAFGGQGGPAIIEQRDMYPLLSPQRDHRFNNMMHTPPYGSSPARKKLMYGSKPMESLSGSMSGLGLQNPRLSNEGEIPTS